VKCGFWHSLALTKNGEVYAWGLISTGVSIEQMTQSTPKKVDCFAGERVVMISCGYKHSLALTESGRVFSWGENSHGQLGTEFKMLLSKKLAVVNAIVCYFLMTVRFMRLEITGLDKSVVVLKRCK
jgi:alpha-tubulin suppressor-like RCC1 family protein